jgi:predicted site-specific integrase-resolvase
MIVKKISLTKCAELCGISRVTLYAYIKKGLITPHKTPGGKPFVVQEDVDTLKKVIENGI